MVRARPPGDSSPAQPTERNVRLISDTHLLDETDVQKLASALESELPVK
jgi:hypothetical protein